LLHPISRPCQPLWLSRGTRGQGPGSLLFAAEPCLLRLVSCTSHFGISPVWACRRTLLSRNCLLPFVCTFQ
jgi:hypothetical protein